MKRIWLVAASCLAIVACTAPQAGCSSITGEPPGTVSVTADEKAMLVLDAAVRGAAISVSAAVDSGQLKGENAAKAAAALRQARAALGVARTAYRIGDTTGFLRAKATAETAVAETVRLAPPQQ